MKSIVHLDSKLRIEDVEDILQQPVMLKVNAFTQRDVDDFEQGISEAHSTGQPIIPVVIDSYGGSSYGCMAMVSAILNSRLPVATIVTGKAQSAAAILFAFGTEGHRYMDPHAFLMIHDMSSDCDGKIEDLKVDMQHVEVLNRNIYKRMARHVGQPENYFLDLIKASNHLDLHLNAKQAKKHRLANVLKVPTLEVHVKVEYTFGTKNGT